MRKFYKIRRDHAYLNAITMWTIEGIEAYADDHPSETPDTIAASDSLDDLESLMRHGEISMRGRQIEVVTYSIEAVTVDSDGEEIEWETIEQSPRDITGTCELYGQIARSSDPRYTALESAWTAAHHGSDDE